MLDSVVDWFVTRYAGRLRRGTLLCLRDAGEGWFQDSDADLTGVVERTVGCNGMGGPWYLVRLHQRVTPFGSQTPSSTVLITCRMMGDRITKDAEVLVYVCALPVGSEPFVHKHLIQRPDAWALCSPIGPSVDGESQLSSPTATPGATPGDGDARRAAEGNGAAKHFRMSAARSRSSC